MGYTKETLIDWNGKTQSLETWTKELKLPYDPIWKRFDRGWEPEKAFTTPLQTGKIKYREDITGMIFNKLIVISYSHTDHYGSNWNCRCDCGKEITTRISRLKNGSTKSCGCLLKLVGERTKTHGKTSGGVSRVYQTWINMIRRCNDPKQVGYNNYGGRGIKVCERWRRFEDFYEDMGDFPKGWTIERMDVNGNYCPENCIAATMKHQANNKRTNHLLTIDGETKNIMQWSEMVGGSKGRIANRLRYGWDEKEAVFADSRQPMTATLDGKTQTVSVWCKQLNINYQRIHYLIKHKGLTPNEAFAYVSSSSPST